MSSPKYVPQKGASVDAVYVSPPKRPGSWNASRPGEAKGEPTTVGALGSVGPDQGYAYKLVDHFRDRLHTGSVEPKDAIAGCVAVAMKRAALFGRAPVSHDLEVAFRCFGFLTSSASEELVEMREPQFAEVANHHHYTNLRELVDSVSNDFLRKSHDRIESDCSQDWKAPFTAKNN